MIDTQPRLIQKHRVAKDGNTMRTLMTWLEIEVGIVHHASSIWIGFYIFKNFMWLIEVLELARSLSILQCFLDYPDFNYPHPHIFRH